MTYACSAAVHATSRKRAIGGRVGVVGININNTFKECCLCVNYRMRWVGGGVLGCHVPAASHVLHCVRVTSYLT